VVADSFFAIRGFVVCAVLAGFGLLVA